MPLQCQDRAQVGMTIRPAHAIAIVAHTARLEQADGLAAKVNANAVLVDDGTLGCNANHRRAWERLAEGDSEWSLCMEDDALPVDGFNEQLEQVLAVAPSPVVSLYLGRLRPPHWQHRIRNTLANTDAHWLTAPALLHAVAVCIRTEILPLMLHGSPTHKPMDAHKPIDEAIGTYARRNGIKVAYCNPSLVDHADQGTLIAHPDRQPRKPGRVAWRVGTRDMWTSSTAAIR